MVDCGLGSSMNKTEMNPTSKELSFQWVVRQPDSRLSARHTTVTSRHPPAPPCFHSSFPDYLPGILCVIGGTSIALTLNGTDGKWKSGFQHECGRDVLDPRAWPTLWDECPDHILPTPSQNPGGMNLDPAPGPRHRPFQPTRV